MRKKVVVVAPHPDDELIGCWEVLKESKKSTIFYVEEVEKQRIADVQYLKKLFSVDEILFQAGNYSLLEDRIWEFEECRFYFPDPVYEIHPAHRIVGSIGERFFRSGFDVVFYSVNMNAPYIHETGNPKEKLQDLNYIYGSEKSLWENDHKYFLFEGRCKWIL